MAQLHISRPSLCFRVKNEYCAEMLRDLRLDSDKKGCLLDGTFGTYANIAKELEIIVKLEKDEAL